VIRSKQKIWRFVWVVRWFTGALVTEKIAKFYQQVFDWDVREIPELN
jgi:predicted enzyme related to lactoylglutathione lyase